MGGVMDAEQCPADGNCACGQPLSAEIHAGVPYARPPRARRLSDRAEPVNAPTVPRVTPGGAQEEEKRTRIRRAKERRRSKERRKAFQGRELRCRHAWTHTPFCVKCGWPRPSTKRPARMPDAARVVEAYISAGIDLDENTANYIISRIAEWSAE